MYTFTVTISVDVLSGTESKNLVDLILSNPDDDQEDHTWRDETITMIAAVRSSCLHSRY